MRATYYRSMSPGAAQQTQEPLRVYGKLPEQATGSPDASPNRATTTGTILPSPIWS